MSEAKHTPGKWAATFGNLIRITSNGKTICGIHKIGKFENNSRVSDEVRANAHLITASPKLLSACQAAYSQMLQMPHDMLRAKSQNALVELRDSIAQALNLEPEYVQTSYEEAVNEARGQ